VKGGDNANVISGKKMFVAKCGSCHTLARAETKGVVGPNLDEAFRASLDEGLKRDTIRGAVEKQIQIPNPEGAMPKNLVSGSALKDIAAYVAQSTVEMPNMSGVSHNIAIETGEGGAAAKGSKIGASEFTTKTTAKVTVSLKAGTYTFFCEAPGHRAAGMFGTLTVK
jgi:cytochrome c553